MDRVSDIWKKFPLLVVGETSATLTGAQHLPRQAIGTLSEKNIFNFYILLNLPTGELPDVISRLEKLGVSAHQLLVCLPPGIAFSHLLLPTLGIFDQIEGESPDDLRARLFSRLEAQKQKKLPLFFSQLDDEGIIRNLAEQELQNLLDSVRLTHALCCAYELPPLAHGAALRACLLNISNNLPDSPWTVEIPIEQLISEAAAIVVCSHSKGLSIRESLRERSAALPFRTRTELFHHLETALDLAIVRRSYAA